MTSYPEEVLVRISPAGVPLAITRNGRVWFVGAEPIRWFERTAWWKHQRRMPKGQGRVDVQVWRIQARLGHNPRSELVTMELECDSDGGAWRMRGPIALAG
ncbi:hypothetical protein SAMN04489740_0558 [Arthrobacter alpinus]|uniref:Uncharacterized protein n=1 Tax=Arthrobacter alpinus TaxID=656366 RepID=A0A0U3QVV9_9MICC|nr:hypothetical protein [Arthrobacter alpinus]ALV45675.1 hypothetical protein MB46_09435 [Arthrobacter alpinus]SEE05159.1 hypothetical protein SAMN04489740_0558 [Arthrobacter alpinus]